MFSNFQQTLILKANTLPELSSKQNQPRHSNNNNNKITHTKNQTQNKEKNKLKFQGANLVNEKI